MRTFDAVSVWRSLDDYYPDPDEPQLATVSFTTAIAAAAATVCEHASDKIARLRGRRAVSPGCRARHIRYRVRHSSSIAL